MSKQSVVKHSAIAAVLAASMGFTACATDLTESPRDILTADNLFVDAAGFDAAVNGLYAQVRQERQGSTSSSNNIRSQFWTLGTDVAWSLLVDPATQFYNGWGSLANPSFTVNLSMWTWLYQTINAANAVIGRAENPDVRWTEAQKNRTVAEARLIRAWAYRHLTYSWGDVPLTLEESSGTSVRTDWERTPIAEVRKQMEEDLLFAEAVLPETTPDAARVSKAVAQHYLAELYLAMDQPAKAEASAEAVINSGAYHLITERYGIRASQPGVPFMDQFLDGNVNRDQGNTEALWTFQYELKTVGGGNSVMRRHWLNRYWSLGGVALSVENGGRGVGYNAPTAWAINNYEPQDDRGSQFAIRKYYIYNTTAGLPQGKAIGDTVYLKWVEGTETSTSWDWPSVAKWEWADPANLAGSGSFGDEPYLRLAETYLLAAEAEMKQGKLDEAADHINIVRRRAHASDITPAQVTLDFILDERARELLTEENRRYTLVRTGTWFERTRKYNPVAGPNIAEFNKLYPIPQAVIDSNLGAEMPQNPGY